MIQYINFLRVIGTISVIFIHTGSMFFSSSSLSDGSYEYCAYSFFNKFFSFAVPLFVLISGSLLLNPAKIISKKMILQKYIFRIVRVLLLFGFVCA